MVNVKLKGLKIVRSKGKYYVYVRSTGEKLLNAFEGNNDALKKRLAMPDMIGFYNARRNRDPKSYPEKSLGWLVDWFYERPEFNKLHQSTQKEYKKCLAWLEPEYDCPLDAITQGELYEVRDRCVTDKWPTFADHMMTALSSMFTTAVKRKKMAYNPAKGMDKARTPNPHANREWRPEEWETAFSLAPPKFKIVMMIARYAGYRGQSIVKIKWEHYQPDPDYGKCFRFTHKKNDEHHWIPAAPELQKFLDNLSVKPIHYIVTKHDGTPWKTEKELQTQFSTWIARLEKKGLIGPDLTLHGLRVTFSAAIKREALKRNRPISNAAVAAALGDRDETMGAHYTRHVENEAMVIQAFPKPDKNNDK